LFNIYIYETRWINQSISGSEICTYSNEVVRINDVHW
jgi:hypothetical protein